MNDSLANGRISLGCYPRLKTNMTRLNHWRCLFLSSIYIFLKFYHHQLEVWCWNIFQCKGLKCEVSAVLRDGPQGPYHIITSIILTATLFDLMINIWCLQSECSTCLSVWSNNALSDNREEMTWFCPRKVWKPSSEVTFLSVEAVMACHNKRSFKSLRRFPRV